MVGIKDVAERAGVSISTVSYVFSGKRPLKEETRDKVIAAAKELQYTPNAGAQLLRGARRHILALSSPIGRSTLLSIYSRFFFETVIRARKYGYDVLLLAGQHEEKELERVVESGLVDGVILLEVEINDTRAAMAERLGCPFVAIGYPENNESIYSVDIDFVQMGCRAVDILAAKGHREILYIGTVESEYRRGANFHIRLRKALSDQAARRGIIFHCSYNTGDDAADVGNLIDATFKSHPSISAILSATNLIHMNNAIVSLRKRGLSVPGDVSFIALCMQGDANNLDVPVDEFPLLPSETCADAVDLMMSVLDGNEHKPGEVKLIPPHYLDRGSVSVRSH
ncbi:LacI family DNA-binding transcriptional regulator [Bifidobacterium sp. UTBIF-78]|uniref:LacI family DNA-binding transcriptional regulator n=1 Tax=Bifidobacterium sp. UTBIF-78 TaxID=1465263 RepID=UPI0011277376|nr:LacI family DNA-binding transcriptional regulator [Bifidobacterium sp. UTBIF-78]